MRHLFPVFRTFLSRMAQYPVLTSLTQHPTHQLFLPVTHALPEGKRTFHIILFSAISMRTEFLMAVLVLVSLNILYVSMLMMMAVLMVMMMAVCMVMMMAVSMVMMMAISMVMMMMTASMVMMVTVSMVMMMTMTMAASVMTGRNESYKYNVLTGTIRNGYV